MSLNNSEILETANAYVAQGDYEQFLSYCTEDTEWTFVGDQVLKGKEAVRQYISTAYLEPPKFDVEHTISEGDYVTVIGKISIKEESGSWPTYDYCDVWKFRDGKLAAVKAFVIEAK